MKVNRKPLPRSLFVRKNSLQHLTGVHSTSLPSKNKIKNKITDKASFSGYLIGKWGSATISICCARDAVNLLVANKHAGVRDIAVSLGLKVSGAKEPVKHAKLMRVNTAKLRTVAIVRIPIQQDCGMINALNVVRAMICNSLTLNHYGLVELINGQ